jgi:hypothetical protein
MKCSISCTELLPSLISQICLPQAMKFSDGLEIHVDINNRKSAVAQIAVANMGPVGARSHEWRYFIRVGTVPRIKPICHS